MLRNLLLLSLWAAGTHHARAFGLVGPLAPWMDQVKGFTPLPPGMIGGPMNIGEDYRWNVRSLTYGFNPNYLQYFGSKGVAAVEKAIQMLNALPPASRMDLSQYPLNSTRVNYQASALLLTDVTSTVLNYLVDEMGLGGPETTVWIMRDHYDFGNPSVPYFYVVQRNFDPVTWEPTSYINGTLYTFSIFHSSQPQHYAFTIPAPVDPTSASFTTVAYGDASYSYGRYNTGLTRDDVGGLKYIYQHNNYLVENAPTNVAPVNGPIFLSSLSSAAWVVVDVTNTVQSALSPTAPWGTVTVTNATTTNAITGVLTNAAGTNAYVVTALRPGIEKINFVRANYDSLLGQFVTQTNQFVDNFVTNRNAFQQVLQRVLAVPDVSFSAQDFGFFNRGGVDIPVASTFTGTGGWQNNAAANGYLNIGPGSPSLDGPGNITSPINIGLTKVGRFYFNSGLFGTEANSTPLFAWGSFDGSTNAPTVYPEGTSIQDIERQVLGR